MDQTEIHSKTFQRYSLLLIFALSSACSAINSLEEVGASTQAQQTSNKRVNIHDVSILYPITAGSVEGLLKTDRLLTHEVYQNLKVSGDRVPRFNNLHVVSVRFDDCFQETLTSPCDPQMRLVFQPVWTLPQDNFSGAKTLTDDDAVHVFFSLQSMNNYRKVIDRLLQLRSDQAYSAVQGLGVHPILEKQGLNGDYAKALSGIIHDIASQYKVVKIATMAFLGPLVPGKNECERELRRAFSGEGWEFTVTNFGETAGATIAGIEHNQQFFWGGVDVRPAFIERTGGSSCPLPADNSVTTLMNKAIPGKDIQHSNFINDNTDVSEITNIENPATHSPANVDCASCHLSHALSHRLNLNTIPTPAIPIRDNRGMDRLGSLRAFGYLKGSAPDTASNNGLPFVAISRRTANETAAVVARTQLLFR